MLDGSPWSVKFLKVNVGLFLLKPIVDALNVIDMLRDGQGRGGRHSISGGSQPMPSVQKNLAVDNVGSNALHLFLLLLLNSKHQSVGVADPSDKIEKTAFDLLEMFTNKVTWMLQHRAVRE